MPRRPAPPKSWDDYPDHLIEVLTKLSDSPYAPVLMLSLPRNTAYSQRHRFYQFAKSFRKSYQTSEETREKFKRMCPGLRHEDLYNIQVSLRIHDNGFLAELEFKIIRIEVMSQGKPSLRSIPPLPPSRIPPLTQGAPQLTAEDIIRAAQRHVPASVISTPDLAPDPDKPLAYPPGMKFAEEPKPESLEDEPSSRTPPSRTS